MCLPRLRRTYPVEVLQAIGETQGEAPVAGRIPQIIHQYWTGDPCPDDYLRYHRRWAEMNPEWEVVLWGDESLPSMAFAPLMAEATRWAPPRNANQFKSDLVRYELLERFGGVWIDMDFEPLRPIAHWPVDWDSGQPFATWEEQDRWVANAILGAAPRDPFILELQRQLPQSVFDHAGKRPAVSTGPQFLTRLYRQFHERPLQVLPQALFYPYSYRDLGTPRARGPWPRDCMAVHHWNNQRRRLKAELRNRRAGNAS